MDEVWSNDIYECQVRYLDQQVMPGRHRRQGAVHLSIKRLDRAASHDWRHLQSIKNEVCGAEREAVELYPAESRLVDGANQTHLWAMPAGDQLPLGFRERVVATQEQMMDEMRKRTGSEELVRQATKARQRPWQPGLSTGPEVRP